MTIVGNASGDTDNGNSGSDSEDNNDNNNDSDTDVKVEPLKAGKINVVGTKNVGDEITLNASATGGDGTYKYKYTITDKNGDVVSSRAFSKESKYLWTPDEEGEYTILVNIKDGNGDTDEVSTTITVSKVEGDSDKDSENDKDDPNSGSNTDKDDPNSGSNIDKDDSGEDNNIDSDEESLEITNIKASKTSGIKVNDKIKITATAKGGSGSYKYKLIEDGKEIGSFVSASNLYYTPKTEGTHTIKVVVSDTENNTIAYSSSKLTLKVTASDEGDDSDKNDNNSTNSGDSKAVALLSLGAILSCFGLLKKKRNTIK